MKTIILANDHAGTLLKEEAQRYLLDKGYDVVNLGVDNEESVDYPDIFAKGCKSILEDKEAYGVFICGTGIGASITANKVSGIHCALVHNGFTAKMAREHNHCRVIAIGARIVDREVLVEVLDTYLESSELGGRHERRVLKIVDLEGKQKS